MPERASLPLLSFIGALQHHLPLRRDRFLGQYPRRHCTRDFRNFGIDFSIQVALVGRHEGLALISRDPQNTAVIDLALEGSAGGLPAPTVGALTGLTKQLAGLELKA